MTARLGLSNMDDPDPSSLLYKVGRDPLTTSAATKKEDIASMSICSRLKVEVRIIIDIWV